MLLETEFESEIELDGVSYLPASIEEEERNDAVASFECFALCCLSSMLMEIKIESEIELDGVPYLPASIEDSSDAIVDDSGAAG